MVEVISAVPRSVRLKAAILGVSDDRAALVYKALKIGPDRFDRALQRICGEVKANPQDPKSPILEPAIFDHAIFLGSLLSTASIRGVRRESVGFPLGLWKGRDGKVDGERNLFFRISGLQDDLSYLAIAIRDPREPNRIGTIRLKKKELESIAEYIGDIRLIPEAFRPDFGTVAKLTHKIPQERPVQVGNLPLQFITQAALEGLKV